MQKLTIKSQYGICKKYGIAYNSTLGHLIFYLGEKYYFICKQN